MNTIESKFRTSIAMPYPILITSLVDDDNCQSHNFFNDNPVEIVLLTVASVFYKKVKVLAG